MEAGRTGRGGGGRGSQWKRGGSAGQTGDNSGTGERRGRGRGGHYRSRGKRDHYRGRGRAQPGDGAADLFRRGHDEQNQEEELEEETLDFSRRKLESNWDRYEESERARVDEDVPVERGTDFQVLLGSAGDSFTQFRFSEEKDWEMDSLAANQVPALFVDLESLAQSLQELPLHKRLNLEPDLVQVCTPVELPSVGKLHGVHPKVLSGIKPPAPAGQEPHLRATRPVKAVTGISLSSHTSTTVISAADDADEELDLLLGLQEPITELSLASSGTSNPAEGILSDSEKAALKVETGEQEQPDVSPDDERRKQQTGEESEQEGDSGKPEPSEDDLEDWLDSMIS